jgi:hypothetical protein
MAKRLEPLNPHCLPVPTAPLTKPSTTPVAPAWGSYADSSSDQQTETRSAHLSSPTGIGDELNTFIYLRLVIQVGMSESLKKDR